MASKGPVMMPAPSTYAEACARAQKLVPILAGRAARTEDARRISDETFADLHQTGLLRILQPRAVGVVIAAEHSCMTLRGANAVGSSTVTSTLLGTLRDDPRSRAEFLAVTGIAP